MSCGTEERVLLRTTISVEVLSEGKIPEGMPLKRVIEECEEGDFVLASVEVKEQRLTEEQMREALEGAASDPDFFNLGCDTDDGASA